MTMAEHSELVAEINYVEKLTPQERLKHAKKRRQQQLKKYGQYEKHLLKEQTKKHKATQPVSPPPKHSSSSKVEFVSHIVLLEAASRNDLEEVKNLLQRGVSPDVTNEDGLTALHQCCIDNSEEMLKILLQHGANVNARDSELWTPLHASATCGHINLCKYLIDGGAELLAVNADGNMPYDICEDEITLDYIETEMAKKGVTQEEIDETRISTEKQMLKELQEHFAEGGSLEFTDRSNATPLHIAAANGYIDVAEFLLEKQVSVEARDEDGWQAVHAAACWCEPEILEMLVHHGADLDAKTRNGETPFDICEDPDLKQRILDMKDELETKAANKQREHDQMRRRSRNRRSASIRRTSMREKPLLSLKEAREEAAHFGVTRTDEEENNDNGTPNGDDSKCLPSTNIDDIAVTLNGDDEDNALDSVGLTNGNSPNPVRESPKVNGNNSPPPVNGVNPSEPSRVHEKTSSQVPPQLPEKASRSSAHTGSSNENNNKNVSQSSQRSGYINGDMDSVNDSQTIVYETHSLGRRSLTSHADSDFNYPAIVNRPGAAPVRYPSSGGSGTLADLKKQRAEKSGTLRQRESANLDAHVQNMFLDTVSYSEHSRDSYSSLPRTKHESRNGHTVVSNQSSRSDRPLRRFTAPGNAPVIGGDDEQKTKCCVLM